MRLQTLVLGTLLLSLGVHVFGDTHMPAPKLMLAYSEVPAPPYQISHTAPLPGVAIDIINRAAKELGILVEYTALPNKRVLEALKQNVFDGAFMYSFKEKRMQYGVYPMQATQPDPSYRLAELSYYLYRRSEDTSQWTGDNYLDQDILVGANTGYSIAGDLRKLGVKVEEAATTEQNFSKLALGRIDAFAHQDLVADRYLERLGLRREIAKVEPSLSRKNYFLMFSHRFVTVHPQLANSIWQRIAEIRDEVTHNRLPLY